MCTLQHMLILSLNFLFCWHLQNERKNVVGFRDIMDFKGIKWVGNVYQKFEAMCLEVEEIIVQVNALLCKNL